MCAAVQSLLGDQCQAPTPPRAALLYRAKAFIEKHANSDALHPRRVADALGISIRYLQGLFAEAGTTPDECIWTTRLRHAHQALSLRPWGNLSIGEIALRCGFKDLAHFSRRFKAAYGVAPREFRGRVQRSGKSG